MPTRPLLSENVFDEPVDRVVSVGGVVHHRRVLGTMQRTVHDVVAFRAVLAANVLDDADVTAFDDHVGGVVVAVQRGAEIGAVRVTRERARVVRRARQEDRRVARAFGHEDDGVQLDAVAHRDHHLAARVVEAGVGGVER